MEIIWWIAQIVLAISLLAGGGYALARLLDATQAARRAGRDDARRARLKRQSLDAYWEGYNQEMYGDPDGPTVRAQLKAKEK